MRIFDEDDLTNDEYNGGYISVVYYRSFEPDRFVLPTKEGALEMEGDYRYVFKISIWPHPKE